MMGKIFVRGEVFESRKAALFFTEVKAAEYVHLNEQAHAALAGWDPEGVEDVVIDTVEVPLRDGTGIAISGRVDAEKVREAVGVWEVQQAAERAARDAQLEAQAVAIREREWAAAQMVVEVQDLRAEVERLKGGK
ncbi:MAG: hypothetical protein HYV27_15345 [Candidatus Hydrogenedentes bacterium]|nr:hypothetical protein [Candidatus Hydrogenedentota bacterium]